MPLPGGGRRAVAVLGIAWTLACTGCASVSVMRTARILDPGENEVTSGSGWTGGWRYRVEPSPTPPGSWHRYDGLVLEGAYAVGLGIGMDAQIKFSSFRQVGGELRIALSQEGRGARVSTALGISYAYGSIGEPPSFFSGPFLAPGMGRMSVVRAQGDPAAGSGSGSGAAPSTGPEEISDYAVHLYASRELGRWAAVYAVPTCLVRTSTFGTFHARNDVAAGAAVGIAFHMMDGLSTGARSADLVIEGVYLRGVGGSPIRLMQAGIGTAIRWGGERRERIRDGRKLRAENEYATALQLYGKSVFEEARQHAEAALAAGATDWKTWHLLGSCRYAVGDDRGAASAWNASLHLNPDNPELREFMEKVGALPPQKKPEPAERQEPAAPWFP